MSGRSHIFVTSGDPTLEGSMDIYAHMYDAPLRSVHINTTFYKLLKPDFQVNLLFPEEQKLNRWE